MKVLIDALGIEQPGGGRTATLNLLQGLADLRGADEWVALVSRTEPSLARHPRLQQIVLPVRNRFASRIAAEILLPALARRIRADLVHHSKNLLTAWAPCPRVVTIYDLTILAHPELYPAVDVAYWRHVEPRMLRSMKRIIAISQTTAHELSSRYRLDRSRVDVVYPGLDPSFKRDGGVNEAMLSSYGLRPGYALHVGSISRKKNLLPLVRAVERLRRDGWEGQLALVGRAYSKGQDEALFEHLRSHNLGDAVRLTGPVPQTDLPDLYRGAGVFVFPSVHEGFGLVPAEAMACGVPVVSSAGGALGEVLGGAAIVLDDASDELALSEAIRVATQEGPERLGLIERGLARATRFTREASVRRTVEIYRTVAGS